MAISEADEGARLDAQASGERLGIKGGAEADLLAAARLHEIGKAWVPPEILEQPAPLEDRWNSGSSNAGGTAAPSRYSTVLQAVLERALDPGVERVQAV